MAGRLQTYFCYTCGKRIAGYDHFRDGGCTLFTLQDIQVRHGSKRRYPARVHCSLLSRLERLRMYC